MGKPQCCESSTQPPLKTEEGAKANTRVGYVNSKKENMKTNQSSSIFRVLYFTSASLALPKVLAVFKDGSAEKT